MNGEVEPSSSAEDLGQLSGFLCSHRTYLERQVSQNREIVLQGGFTLDFMQSVADFIHVFDVYVLLT